MRSVCGYLSSLQSIFYKSKLSKSLERHMQENFIGQPAPMRRPSSFETHTALAAKPEGVLRGSNLRFAVLALISFVNFGASFTTSPAIIAFGFDENLISLATYVPYIFIPVFGGVIVDKWSARNSLLLFGLFLAVGNIMLSINFSSETNSIFAWVLGVILIIIGSGVIIVAQATITAKWFRNKELAFAIGSYLCVSKIGSLLGYAVMFDNYQSDYSDNYSDYDSEEDVQQSVLNFGVAFSIFSFVCIIALAVLDKHADFQDTSLTQNIGSQEIVEPAPVVLKNYPVVFYLLICSLFIQATFLSLDTSLFYELIGSQGAGPNGGLILSEAIDAVEFYTLMGIFFSFLFPLLGYFVDKFGKQTSYLLISSIVFTFMCAIFIITLATMDSVNYMYFRLSYAFLDAIFQPVFLCVFWFCIPLVFDQKIMGTGTAIAVSTLNLMSYANDTVYEFIFGFGDNPNSVNFYNQTFSSYFWFLIYVAVLGFFGSIFSYWLFREDVRTGKKLSNPSIIYIEKERAQNLGLGFGQPNIPFRY